MPVMYLSRVDAESLGSFCPLADGALPFAVLAP